MKQHHDALWKIIERLKADDTSRYILQYKGRMERVLDPLTRGKLF